MHWAQGWAAHRTQQGKTQHTPKQNPGSCKTSSPIPTDPGPNHLKGIRRTRDLRKREAQRTLTHKTPLFLQQTILYPTQHNLGSARQICSPGLTVNMSWFCGAKTFWNRIYRHVGKSTGFSRKCSKKKGTSDKSTSWRVTCTAFSIPWWWHELPASLTVSQWLASFLWVAGVPKVPPGTLWLHTLLLCLCLGLTKKAGVCIQGSKGKLPN